MPRGVQPIPVFHGSMEPRIPPAHDRNEMPGPAAQWRPTRSAVYGSVQNMLGKKSFSPQSSSLPSIRLRLIAGRTAVQVRHPGRCTDIHLRCTICHQQATRIASTSFLAHPRGIMQDVTYGVRFGALWVIVFPSVYPMSVWCGRLCAGHQEA